MTAGDAKGLQVGDHNTQDNHFVDARATQTRGLQVNIYADQPTAATAEATTDLVTNLGRRNAGFVGRDAVLERMRGCSRTGAGS